MRILERRFFNLRNDYKYYFWYYIMGSEQDVWRIKDKHFLAILALPVGYFAHVLKSKFDKKEIIKSTNRLFKSDINKIIEFSKRYNENQVYGVVSDKFTSFNDWKAEFNKISSSLDNEQSSQLIDIYSTVNKIVEVQSECKEYYNEIKRKYPNIKWYL